MNIRDSYILSAKQLSLLIQCQICYLMQEGESLWDIASAYASREELCKKRDLSPLDITIEDVEDIIKERYEKYY